MVIRPEKNGHVYEKACFGKKKSFYSLDINPPPVCSLMASLIATHLADQLIRPDWLMALQFSTNYIFDWVLRAGKKWSCCAGLEKCRGQPLIFWSTCDHRYWTAWILEDGDWSIWSEPGFSCCHLVVETETLGSTVVIWEQSKHSNLLLSDLYSHYHRWQH